MGGSRSWTVRGWSEWRRQRWDVITWNSVSWFIPYSMVSKGPGVQSRSRDIKKQTLKRTSLFFL